MVAETGSAVVGGFSFPAPPGGTGYGSRSAALTIDGTKGDFAALRVNFCPSGAATSGLIGKLHVMVWYKPTSGGAPAGPGYLYLYDGVQHIGGGTDVNTPANQWFDVPTFNIDSDTPIKYAELRIAGLTGRKGVLYIDNIYFD